MTIVSDDKGIFWQSKFTEAVRRAEAAEQRLQEAQAEIERLRNVFAETNRDLVQANTRLRQREAELEQLRAERDKLEEQRRLSNESFTAMADVLSGKICFETFRRRTRAILAATEQP